MPKKIRVVDLSLEIKDGLPGVLGAQIKYLGHEESVPEMLASWPGIKKEDLPGGQGWAAETLTLNTHSGTHMDAPYHYYSTMAGQKSRTIDEMTLEWDPRAAVCVVMASGGNPDKYVTWYQITGIDQAEARRRLESAQGPDTFRRWASDNATRLLG
jgi:kynurenine formamidase